MKDTSPLLSFDWLNLLSLCMDILVFLCMEDEASSLHECPIVWFYFCVLGWEPCNISVPFVTIIAFQLLSGSASEGLCFPFLFFIVYMLAGSSNVNF